MNFARLALVAALATVCNQALADTWPSRPIRLIVPLTAGSGADVAGRIVARHMSEALKQPVTVENRPGAGGQIGTQVVASSPADGYTLLVQSASHAANPAIYKKLPYDPLKDLVDVALLGVTPYVMVTSKDGPYKTPRMLVDDAKARPGQVAFASAGVGSSTHLAAEYFAQFTGVKMLHVPYKGSPEAIQDSIAGRTAFYMAPINTAVGHVNGARLTALGVTSKQRNEALPNVPTLAEQGLKDFSIGLWFGMWAPAGTPPDVVQKLNAQVAAALQNKDVREQFSKLGIGPMTMKPDEFARFVREEIATNQRIVASAGIQPE
jgi:tripartite-type tricarboxylate transporter receptor subunit TctC